MTVLTENRNLVHVFCSAGATWNTEQAAAQKLQKKTLWMIWDMNQMPLIAGASVSKGQSAHQAAGGQTLMGSPPLGSCFNGDLNSI